MSLVENNGNRTRKNKMVKIYVGKNKNFKTNSFKVLKILGIDRDPDSTKESSL
jgi:hypothetical protein